MVATVANAVAELVTGAGLLVRGLGLIVRRPRLFLLGAIPPAISSTIFVGVLIVLFTHLNPLVRVLTPFADTWDPRTASVARVLIGLTLAGGVILLMVISFTALTLALGSPLYEKISEAVEEELGSAPKAYDEPLAKAAVRSVRQSLGLIGVSAVVAAALFFVGFVPILGQTVVPVVAAMFGGWVLGIELVGSAFDRRGLLTMADRRAAMRRRKAHVLGLTVPTFLLLAIPFAGAAVFPVATAAGTILARDLLAAHPAPAAGRSRSAGGR
jgi:CysZ protein